MLTIYLIPLTEDEKKIQTLLKHGPQKSKIPNRVKLFGNKQQSTGFIKTHLTLSKAPKLLVDALGVIIKVRQHFLGGRGQKLKKN